MANFSIDKKGYNTQEVDKYINKLCLKYEEKLRQQKDRVSALRNEIETLNGRLNNYVDKDEQISKALLYAVEKADQIENNAKNVYNMEIKRINALYSRWEELLLEVENNCPGVNENRYINSLMEDFKNSITEVSKTGLTLNTKSIKDDLKNSSDQFIRNILNRMDYVVNNPIRSAGQNKRQIRVNPLLSTPVEKTPAPKSTHAKTSRNVVEPVKSSILTKATPTATAKPSVSKTNSLKSVPVKKPVQAEKPITTKKTTAKVQPKVAESDSPKSYSSISSISERLKHLNLVSKTNTVGTSKKNESLADKFLNSDDEIKLNAYSKNFAKKKLERSNPFMFIEYPEPNETGFDLKDALNPKEDLDEIMKSFDFFEDDNKKNK